MICNFCPAQVKLVKWHIYRDRDQAKREKKKKTGTRTCRNNTD